MIHRHSMFLHLNDDQADLGWREVPTVYVELCHAHQRRGSRGVLDLGEILVLDFLFIQHQCRESALRCLEWVMF